MDTSQTPPPGGPPGRARSVRFSFGTCELETRTLELVVAGEKVKLERKPLEVLICLLDHAGEVVTKDELLEAVWHGRVLSDSVLTKCMARLRRVLGEQQSMIRTVHGYGYRLVAEVRIDHAGAEPAVSELRLEPGTSPPLRPLWRLEQRLAGGGLGEAWLTCHRKTGERRVLKFAIDAAGVVSLRREITLHRVLRATLGPRPDLVRILDWNLEEPPFYLEIEYVPGGSLSTWAEAQGGLDVIPLAMRLDLITQMAEAVAAAHSAGVLHKDLKPANVLIDSRPDGTPQVRLTDFGSGVLTDPGRLEALDITRVGLTAVSAEASSGGTPLYLAPELLHGQVPTARSDIYALGVMLYQLVVGDLRKSLAVGWEREISDPLLREDIAAAAAGDRGRRLSEASLLASRIASLEQRRAQRAAREAEQEQARQLQSALDDARRRRRRLGFASATLGLVLAVVVSLLLQVRSAEERARQEANAAAAVNAFLTQDLLSGANPMVSGRRDVPLRELLDAAAEGIGRRLEAQPGTEASIRLALGSLYRNLGDHETAARELELAISLARRARLQPVLTQGYLEFARLQIATDDFTAALATIEPVLESPDRDTRLQAWLLHGWALQNLGEFEQALALFAQLQDEVEQHYGSASPTLGTLLGYQAVTLERLSRYSEAVTLHRRQLALQNSLHGAGHVQTLNALRGLGSALFMVGDYSEAVAHISAGHAIAVRVLGPAHADSLSIAADLGLLHAENGAPEQGLQLMLETLATSIATYGEGRRDVRTLLNNIGLLYSELGDHERELVYLERAYLAEVAAMGERDFNALISAHNFARALARAERFEEAHALGLHTIDLAISALGPEHSHVGIMKYSHAYVLGRLGDFAAAEWWFTAAIAILDQHFDAEHLYSRRARELRDEIRQLASAHSA